MQPPTVHACAYSGTITVVLPVPLYILPVRALPLLRRTGERHVRYTLDCVVLDACAPVLAVTGIEPDERYPEPGGQPTRLAAHLQEAVDILEEAGARLACGPLAYQGAISVCDPGTDLHARTRVRAGAVCVVEVAHRVWPGERGYGGAAVRAAAAAPEPAAGGAR